MLFAVDRGGGSEKFLEQVGIRHYIDKSSAARAWRWIDPCGERMAFIRQRGINGMNDTGRHGALWSNGEHGVHGYLGRNAYMATCFLHGKGHVQGQTCPTHPSWDRLDSQNLD